MLYGMGTVVLFLALLVVATAAMSALLTRYFPEPEPVPARRPARGQAAADTETADPAIVAAISAAIHRHRADGR